MMNIFISHSSYDRWVARTISQQLNDLGITTFLDEKDIQTGESIDDSVTQHLKDCDELLVLLSPASLKSQWVLIEVGGAKVLGKRLVPILLHVAPNEIPQPISKHLAREINDIERFYEEVKARLAANAPPPEPVPPPLVHVPLPIAPPDQLAVGDRVRVARGSTLSSVEKALPPRWTPEMDQYSRQEATVTRIIAGTDAARDDPDPYAYELNISGPFWWNREWLVLVQPP